MTTYSVTIITTLGTFKDEIVADTMETVEYIIRETNIIVKSGNLISYLITEN